METFYRHSMSFKMNQNGTPIKVHIQKQICDLAHLSRSHLKTSRQLCKPTQLVLKREISGKRHRSVFITHSNCYWDIPAFLIFNNLKHTVIWVTWQVKNIKTPQLTVIFSESKHIFNHRHFVSAQREWSCR